MRNLLPDKNQNDDRPHFQFGTISYREKQCHNKTHLYPWRVRWWTVLLWVLSGFRRLERKVGTFRQRTSEYAIEWSSRKIRKFREIERLWWKITFNFFSRIDISRIAQSRITDESRKISTIWPYLLRHKTPNTFKWRVYRQITGKEALQPWFIEGKGSFCKMTFLTTLKVARKKNLPYSLGE